MNPVKHEITLAFSLANLFFIRIWILVLGSPSPYYMKWQPNNHLIAVLVNVIILGTVIFLGIRMVGRSSSKWNNHIAGAILLAILLIPANAVRLEYFSKMSGRNMSFFLEYKSIIGFMILGLILLCIIYPIVFRTIICYAQTLILIISPLLFFTTGQACWALFTSAPQSYYSNHPPLKLVSKRSLAAQRVVILIFDELDEGVLRVSSDIQVVYPAFDTLIKSSFCALNAVAPGNRTLESLPSLLCGRVVKKAEPYGTSDLKLGFYDNKREQLWSTQHTIFASAREKGYSTALAGWYHPYCRILGKDLDLCQWESKRFLNDPPSTPLLVVMMKQVRHCLQLRESFPFSSTLEVEQHRKAYEAIAAAGRSMILDDSIDLVFIHLPVPHGPFIYSARLKVLLPNPSATGLSRHATYLDNVALADATLASFLANISRDTKRKTAIIVTSDHPLKESSGLTQKSLRIPFMVKLAEDSRTVSYSSPINTVLMADLALSILDGKLRTHDDVSAWITKKVSNISNILPVMPSGTMPDDS